MMMVTPATAASATITATTAAATTAVTTTIAATAAAAAVAGQHLGIAPHESDTDHREKDRDAKQQCTIHLDSSN
ncbi:MAG TPA: hypothetical protein VMV69_08035 [Pirellulales bacterium]|nr:hypothetical protein [Pirellulales bacterium]